MTTQAVALQENPTDYTDKMERIKHLLNQETEGLSSLLEALDKEKDILLKGQHQDLMANSEHKLEICQQLESIQKARQELVLNMVIAGEPIVKLSQLAPLLQAEQRDAFREQLIKADNLSKQLHERNQLNRAFINEALDSIGHVLSIISNQHNASGYNEIGRAHV